MSREIAFSTFMKILELKDKARLAAIKGMQRGGGYQYWRPLTMLSPAVMRGDVSIDEIENRVNSLTQGHQAKYNTSALLRLGEWAAQRDIAYRQRPAVKIPYPIGSMGLVVKVEPEVAFMTNGGDEFHMHVWATRSPSLTDHTLSMSMFVFRSAYQNAGRAGKRFVIFDTVRGRLFYEADMMRNAELSLLEQVRDIDRTWQIAESGVAERKRLPRRPDDRPSTEDRF